MKLPTPLLRPLLRPQFILMVALAVGMLCVMLAARSAAIARERCVAATSACEDTLAMAEEIIALRRKQERVSLQARPAQDVIARVNAALAEIGLPSDRFQSLTPESDAPLATGLSAATSASSFASSIRRQSLRLTLTGLTPAEVGMFLRAWSIHQHIWTPSRIELLHERSDKDADEANIYTVNLLLSALYISEQGE